MPGGSLWANDGAVLYRENNNQFDLPDDIRRSLSEIDSLYAQYTKPHMFESYDLKIDEKPTVATEPTVPPNEKVRMASLIEYVASRLREIAPPDWQVEIEIPVSFR